MNNATAGKAWFRLQSALQSGTGHVVVTAAEREKAAALVDAALERSSALAVLRVRAVSADPLAVIDEGATTSRSAGSRREVLRALLEKARLADANVFAVVEDADSASAEELERVRMAVECVPDAIERLRVVLIGTPQLDLTLKEPAASALASRVSAHVRFAPARKTAKVVALNTLSAVRVAATGVMTVAVATLFGRNETPSRREVPSEPTSAREVGAGRTNADTTARTAASVSSTSKREDASVVERSETTAIVETRTDASAAPDPPARAAIDPTDDTAPAADGAHVESVAAHDADVDEAAAGRSPGTAIAHVAAQVGRVARASREGSASVDARGLRGPSSVAPPKRSPAAPAAGSVTRLKQPIIMEAAAFKDAGAAASLQKQLAERFDRVLVTRVDGARGTVYSVRVMGLESPREIAHAEREIRTLGHRPVRISVAAARAMRSADDDVAADPIAEEAAPLSGSLRPRVPRR